MQFHTSVVYTVNNLELCEEYVCVRAFILELLLQLCIHKSPVVLMERSCSQKEILSELVRFWKILDFL